MATILHIISFLLILLLSAPLLGQTIESTKDPLQQVIENQVADVYVYSSFYKNYKEFNRIDSVYHLINGKLNAKLVPLNTIAYSSRLSRLGFNDRALEVIQTLSDSLDYQSLIVQSEYFCTMGGIALGSMKPQFALQQYQKSWALVKDDNTISKEIIQAKIIALGNAYNAIFKHQKAKEMFDEALTYERLGVNRNSLYLRLNIALTNSYLGKLEKAKRYWLDALHIIQENKDDFAAMRTYGNLGDVYLKQDSLVKAHYWYALGMKKAREGMFHTDVFRFQHALSDCFYKQEKLDSAYFYLKRADSLHQVYNTNAMTEKLTEMNLYYEWREEEAEKRMTETLYEIEQDKKRLLFIFCLLLVGLCILLSWQLRISHHKNKVLLKEQLKKINTAPTSQTYIRRATNFDYSKLLEALIEEIEKNKIFTNANLTLEKLAKHLQTNRTYLSEAINLHYQKSFSQWLNE